MSKLSRTIYELLFVDVNTNKVSYTKLWSNIGNLVACVLFCYCVIGDKASTELWFVFGSLVIGNATFNKLLNFKYGKAAENKDE